MRSLLLVLTFTLVLGAEASSAEGDWIDLFARPLEKTFRGPKYGEWHRAAEVTLDPANPKRLLAKGDQGDVWVNGPKGRTNDLYTRELFGDVEVHLEFVMAKSSNSGIKFHGHYEVQITDSYGKPADKIDGSDCGGVYPRSETKGGYHHIDHGIAPRTNACKPPGEWQTLDIVFLAPRFDQAKKKIENARLPRVLLNGTLIHDNVELKTPTGDRWKNPEMAEGPIMLQGDHGPVAFRHVKVRRLEKR